MPDDKNIVGIAGVYFVAGQLSLQKMIALITSRNTRAYDIVVLNPSRGCATGVQVKTKKQASTDAEKDSFPLFNSTGYELEQTAKAKITCPYVLVYFTRQMQPRYFIVPPSDLRRLVKETWDGYIKNSKHRKSISEITKSNHLMAIYVRQVLNYEDKWDNIWHDL